MDQRSRELLNELGKHVAMKYAIPGADSKNWGPSGYQGVPLDLIWQIMSHFTGKTIDELADDGCDANNLG
jgi:hypothetical protein